MAKVTKKVLVVTEDGKVVLEGLPVRKGDQVEVEVRTLLPGKPTYPLHGLPVRYDDPFLAATDESDWDALK